MDKLRIKSEKTGKEQDITPDDLKKLEAQIGKGKHEIISNNTTPPEVTAARRRTSTGTGTGTGNADTSAPADTANTDEKPKE
jgi:hypothetical protein